MSQGIAACEMAHLDPELRLEPLRLAPDALGNWRPGGQEFLNTLLEIISRLIGKRQQSCPCKLQLTRTGI
jgi:hypothetical protein